MTTNIFALLVGINEYQAVSKLRGCVNDVEAVQQFLTEKYSVPEDHIRLLRDKEATRQNILDTFRTFLIQNPNIQRGDQILFWYSGHGSRMRDPFGIEPDGYLETLVPQDSRTKDIHDIPDKVIARLLEDLAEAKGDNVTIVLDSCHSGSGTREIEVEGETVALAREVPADDRIPPADLDAELLKIFGGASGQPSGWSSPTTPYVLLAGCRSHEQSNEYLVPVEGDTKVWHGTLTYFTLKALETIAPDTTYADIHERVSAQVNGIYPTQMPQCEGDRNRAIFGGARVERDNFVLVREFDGDTITLGAGLIMGITPGTRLALYEPTVRNQSHLPKQPLAMVEVTSAQATFSKASIEAENQDAFVAHVSRWAEETFGSPEGASQIASEPLQSESDGTKTPTKVKREALTLGNPAGASQLASKSLKGVIARGVVTERAYVSIPQTVSLWAEEGAENQAAIARLRSSLESPHYRVLEEPARDAKLHMVAVDGQYFIRNFQEELLVEPVAWGDGDVAKVSYALENIARFQTLLGLKNEESGSVLEGNIKVRLQPAFSTPEKVDAVSDGSKTPTKTKREALLPEGAIGAGGEISLIFDSENPDKNLYVVEVENTSPRNVYPHVFVMSADYSIQRLYPEDGLEKALAPEQKLVVQPSTGGSRLEIYLDDEGKWDSSHDYVLVIAATSPSNLSGLEQSGLDIPDLNRGQTKKATPKSALDVLMQTLLDRIGDRGVRKQRVLPQDDWTTVLVPWTTVRKNAAVTLEKSADRIDLGDGLTLVKPKGFTGEVIVTTVTQGTRGAEGDPMLEPPPGLAAFGELFQPLERVGVRSVGPSQLVIAFDLDDASRRSITPSNPLGLEIQGAAGEEGAEYLPVIFDGEDYLLAGYGVPGSNRVNLVELPAAVIPEGDGQPTKRGLLRTLRLFLYKKMGRYTQLTGLHRAELVDGKAVYHDVDRRQFQSGQRVALFVHGFTSDTGWMIQGPAQFLQQEVVPYDHFLTWDYETFGTGIQENGERLALALKQQCGFGSEDGITLDVFAHSMGSLVCRSMIELSGGYEFVDRLVMAGPPNMGSTLATSGRGLLFLANMLLNSASLVPPVGLAQKVLEQILEQGVGLQDLAVDSEILKQLNSLEEPSNVPYLVLAGENLVDEAGYKRLNRLAQKVLDTSLDAIFGEQNDVAVGLSSLRTVRRGGYPENKLKVIPLPCNHFQYFSHPKGRKAIREWLGISF
ncbi:caspase family protein [Nodosilinea sp. AN01ver1]|uniref:caspase family protein n=1 Tax=Nodosilinea sp. AN01ver1 TaxID=3423362 RepID=UPI003D322F66